MNKYRFWGIYAPYIRQLIDLKRSLGFKYITEETIYSIFDRYTIEMGETEVGISKELAENWCQRKNNESDSYRFHRGVCINQLSSFLCKIGIRSYIPRLPKCMDSFTPYIFSKVEIAAIFNAADKLKAQRKMMNSMLFVMPAILRLLYSTGLRIGEAVVLQNKDVNLTDNFLVIRDSKNGKQRMIPISESLSSVCKEYARYRDLLPLSRSENDRFFVSLNGSACTEDAVYRRFQDILKMAGIPFVGNHNGPRVHDLRHTFAVTSLAHMAESGVDLYSTLPILSTYLGHQSLSSTNSYVRLTAEMYPGLLKDIDMVCLNVFPDIKCHEAN
ncbi:MAG: tyrosine-type recombinase/integrase [Bacteroidales bacterium]|nr:tyrosine-type recombinase/integrase [Bacteroidales bacterium]